MMAKMQGQATPLTSWQDEERRHQPALTLALHLPGKIAPELTMAPRLTAALTGTANSLGIKTTVL